MKKTEINDALVVNVMQVACEIATLSDELKASLGCSSDRLEGQVDALVHVVLDALGIVGEHPLTEGLCEECLNVIGMVPGSVAIPEFPQFVREQLAEWRAQHGR